MGNFVGKMRIGSFVKTTPLIRVFYAASFSIGNKRLLFSFHARYDFMVFESSGF